MSFPLEEPKNDNVTPQPQAGTTIFGRPDDLPRQPMSPVDSELNVIRAPPSIWDYMNPHSPHFYFSKNAPAASGGPYSKPSALTPGAQCTQCDGTNRKGYSGKCCTLCRGHGSGPTKKLTTTEGTCPPCDTCDGYARTEMTDSAGRPISGCYTDCLRCCDGANPGLGLPRLPPRKANYALASKPNKIIKGLYIGSEANAADWKLLNMLGITHTLTVNVTNPPGFWPPPPNGSCNIEQLSTNQRMMDGGQTELCGTEWNDDFDQIHAIIRNGGIVLIHCREGVNRSPTFTIAYLMKKTGMSLREAYETVANKRTDMTVVLHDLYAKQLLQMEKQLPPYPAENSIAIGPTKGQIITTTTFREELDFEAGGVDDDLRDNDSDSASTSSQWPEKETSDRPILSMTNDCSTSSSRPAVSARRLAEDNVQPLEIFSAWILLLIIVAAVYLYQRRVTRRKRDALQRGQRQRESLSYPSS